MRMASCTGPLSAGVVSSSMKLSGSVLWAGIGDIHQCLHFGGQLDDVVVVCAGFGFGLSMFVV